MDLLTAVHADQEALIGDLSEQLSTSKAHCAELEATLADLCGPPRTAEGGPEGHPTRVAELQAAENRVAQLTQQLAELKASRLTYTATGDMLRCVTASAELSDRTKCLQLACQAGAWLVLMVYMQIAQRKAPRSQLCAG